MPLCCCTRCSGNSISDYIRSCGRRGSMRLPVRVTGAHESGELIRQVRLSQRRRREALADDDPLQCGEYTLAWLAFCFSVPADAPPSGETWPRPGGYLGTRGTVGTPRKPILDAPPF